MLQEMFDRNVFIYILMGLGAYGLFLKVITNAILSKLIKNSENMGGSNSKLSKQIKFKFESYYKLNIGVNNVDTFVDKYVYKYRICGLLLSTWERIGGQVIAWCVLVGAFAALSGVVYEVESIHILSTSSVGIMTVLILITSEMYGNIKFKNKVLCTNLKDYLENQFKVRLEQEYFHKESLEMYRKEYFKEGQAKNLVEKMSREEQLENEEVTREVDQNLDMKYLLRTINKEVYDKNNKDLGIYKLDKEDEKIIEDILREYLA